MSHPLDPQYHVDDLPEWVEVLHECLDVIAADHASATDPSNPHGWDDTDLLALWRKGKRLLGPFEEDPAPSSTERIEPWT